jgi:hypothetical protein
MSVYATLFLSDFDTKTVADNLDFQKMVCDNPVSQMYKCSNYILFLVSCMPHMQYKVTKYLKMCVLSGGVSLVLREMLVGVADP